MMVKLNRNHELNFERIKHKMEARYDKKKFGGDGVRGGGARGGARGGSARGGGDDGGDDDGSDVAEAVQRATADPLPVGHGGGPWQGEAAGSRARQATWH
jgi:hypothetical protein